MRLNLISATAAALALAACDSGEQPVAEETAAPTPAPLPSEIPAAFQGRWGLSADDCTAENAEGLLEVTETELKFYESVGTLDQVTGATPDRFRGDFAFTGEGTEWQRNIVLDLRNDGRILIRREFGEDAPITPSDYTRCP